MTPSSKQWQVTIRLDREKEEVGTVYGSTFPQLQENVAAWLRETRPVYFTCGKKVFLYSDGTYPTNEFRLRDENGGSKLKEGWYREDQVRGNNNFFPSYPLKTFEVAVTEFVNGQLVPQKGTEFQDLPIMDGKLQLHLLKTLKEVQGESKVNDYLNRGWYIVSIDQVGNMESKSVTSLFVLGHPEQAAV